MTLRELIAKQGVDLDLKLVVQITDAHGNKVTCDVGPNVFTMVGPARVGQEVDLVGKRLVADPHP